MDLRRTTLLAKIEPNLRQGVLLALVYLLLVSQALLPVEDPDLWWHLRTGDWILQQKAVPVTDPFSTYGNGKPWVAYSWLFDVIVQNLFRMFGLTGIVWFTALFALVIALVIHRLVRQAHRNLAEEVLITAAIMIAIKPLMSPRSWLFSIVFFTLEITALLHYRKSRDSKALLWLPLIFLVWANVHLQFLYGLAVLFLFLLEPYIQNALLKNGLIKDLPPLPSPTRKVFLIALCCIAATFVNPYHIYVYKPIFEVIRDTKAFDMIMELQSLSFRSLEAWVFLLLIAAVLFAAGWQREKRLFNLGLLAMAIFLAFRAQRDVWVGAVAAALLIADWPSPQNKQQRLSWSIVGVAGVVIAAGTLYFAQWRDLSEKNLWTHVAKKYPMQAVNFLRQQKMTGPIYNNYDWGGFLIWSLPEFTVSMDGRSNLHTEKRVEENRKTWWGTPRWSSDSELAEAQVVIGPAELPIVSLLKRDNRFVLCYEDRLAAVFVSSKNYKHAYCREQ